MAYIKKYQGAAILLAIAIGVSQCGCTSASRSGGAFPSSNPVSHTLPNACSEYKGEASECRSTREKLRRLQTAETLEVFFSDLHFLIRSDLLRNSVFYESDQYLTRVFGNSSIARELGYSPTGEESGFNITIKLGGALAQRCELHRAPGESISLYCNAPALLYIYDESGRNDKNSAMSKNQQDEFLGKIYKEFRDAFGGDWQDIDAFDRQRGEKIIPVGVMLQPLLPQPKPDGFGQDIQVDDVIYRVRAGRTINGNWNGIMISVRAGTSD
jgi:hypothetical protein